MDDSRLVRANALYEQAVRPRRRRRHRTIAAANPPIHIGDVRVVADYGAP